MASGATLSEFVRWAEGTYPAKKYMLVIWNHGQGWRLYQAFAPEPRAGFLPVAFRPDGPAAGDEPQPCNGPSGQTLTGGFRSISFDEDTGSFLYNRDIANSVTGQHIDVLGFDACLMAMIESAYAFRNVAKVMMASEELVPGDGWNYDLWLRDLMDRADVDGTTLATDFVRSYKETYKDTGDTTLSAIDLTKVTDATQALAKLSLLVKAKMRTGGPILAFTRLSFRTFGDWYGDSWQDCQGSKVVRFHGIDLRQFLKLYARETKDVQIKRERAETELKLKPVIIASYASSLSAGADHWASGLAICFTSSEVDYQCDYDIRRGGSSSWVRAIPTGIR
jgi:hypothetical protein